MNVESIMNLINSTSNLEDRETLLKIIVAFSNLYNISDACMDVSEAEEIPDVDYRKIMRVGSLCNDAEFSLGKSGVQLPSFE